MGKKRIIKKSEIEETSKSAGQTDAVIPQPKIESPTSVRRIRDGRIYVYSSYNNTLMSLTDMMGNVIATKSAGAIGFKGTKKSTPFAASKVAEAIAQIAKNQGIEKVEIYIRGVGAGRDSAIRSLGTRGFEIAGIRDITPIPFNGPKRPKVRRV